ncbi:MAG: ribosomal protein S18-alanine N-acetyltransferase [Lachnospiraceae bacterium]|nr:ribosomal protein S18-alanine N-acetyltransferase [Lachnospiraceae bacterium]
MITIEELEEKDVAAVSQIEERAFSMPWSAGDFLQMVHNENALYLVAKSEGIPIACCGVRNILGEGEITNVVVDKPYRGKGIGGRMLSELLEKGKQMGIEAFTLEVRKSNEAAICLYKKAGFVTEGIRKNFYEKPVEDGLIMWKR